VFGKKLDKVAIESQTWKGSGSYIDRRWVFDGRKSILQNGRRVA
jgi:hypothetical protein